MVDLEQAHTEIEQFLQDELEESEADGYVLGVSGGVDSALTLKLAVNAVGAENVLGLVMPGDPSQDENMKDAEGLCEDLGVPYHTIDIESIVDAFRSAAPSAPGRKAEGNLRVRTRMVLQYMMANEEEMLVLGSSNRTEILLGYFTKFGDGAADVKCIADLYKSEVWELAEHVGLPEKFIAKAPTAGMWEGQTDEDELGADYDTIDTVLKLVADDGRAVEEVVVETGLSRETVESIMGMYENSRHKREDAAYPGLR